MPYPQGNTVTAASSEKIMYLPSSSRYPYYTSITPPKPVLRTVRYSASSFSLHCPFISLTSSSSCLCPLTRLPSPYIFTVVMCFRRQFLCKMCVCVCERERKAASRRFTACMMFCSSLTACHASSFLTRSAQLTSSILLQNHFLKLPRYFRSSFRSIQVSVLYNFLFQNVALNKFLP